MNRKKILIVSRSFYPTKSPRSFRTTELVKEFARLGHEVTLLTVKDNKVHKPFEKEHGVTIKDLGPLRLPRIKPNKNGATSLLKRILNRGLLMLFEYPDIELVFKVSKALKKESGYDLMITVAAPHPVHWGAAKARSKNHPIAKVWVADCGDPYAGRENDSFNVLPHFALVEKWFSRKADYISIPFEGAQSAYFEEFHSKLRVIPQGLSFPERSGDNGSTRNDMITFAYFGNIESYQHYAVPFLERLNSIEKPFRFVVYTKRKDIFQRHLNRGTLKKCLLMNYVERDLLLDQLSHVDFLVHFPYQRDTQKSLKLVDYNYLRKPILEYKNDAFSNRVLEEFLEHNFENKRDFEDYEKYKIENVCEEFLRLTRDTESRVQSSAAGLGQVLD